MGKQAWNVSAAFILLLAISTVSSATEWDGPPPDTMNELFEYTEEALEMEGYRTRELTINEDFFIQIPDEIALAINYDPDAEPPTPKWEFRGHNTELFPADRPKR